MSVTARVLLLTKAMIGFALTHIPMLLIVGALIAIIYYWDQIKAFVMPLITAMQVAVDMVAIGYEKLALGIAHAAAFAAAMVGKQDLAVWWESQAIAIENNIRALEQNISDAMSGKGWAQAVDQGINSIKTAFQSVLDFFQGDFKPQIESTLQQWGQSFEQTFNTAYQAATNIGQQSAQILVSQINMFSSRFGQAFSDMIMKGKNFGEAMKQLFFDMVAQLIASVVQMLIQWAIYQAAQWALVAASVAMAKTIEAAWAGAAAMVSLATMGANSVGAIAGIMATKAAAYMPFAEGGIVTRPTLALIGEAGPEAVIPLGKGGAGTVINIEINNPNVSSMQDIDTLTEEISRRLNAEIERL